MGLERCDFRKSDFFTGIKTISNDTITKFKLDSDRVGLTSERIGPSIPDFEIFTFKLVVTVVNLLYQSQNKIKLLCHYLVCLYLLDTDFRLSGVTLHSIIESTFFLHKKIIKTIKCCSSWLWHSTGVGWTKNQEVCWGWCMLFEVQIAYILNHVSMIIG